MPHVFAQIVHHPVSYEFGPLQFTGFGFAMLMCFVIGQIIAQREMQRRGQDPQAAGDMTFAAEEAIEDALGVDDDKPKKAITMPKKKKKK